MGDFPGDPVVKTSPSKAGGAGSKPGRGTENPASHKVQPEIKRLLQQVRKIGLKSKHNKGKKASREFTAMEQWEGQWMENY